jgi:two-component system response regulator FlrC
VKDFGLFQTVNPAMNRMLESATALATTGAPILISGEQGSGKSLLVQHLANAARLKNEVLKWSSLAEEPEAGDWILVDGIEDLNLHQQDELSETIEQLKFKNIAVRWIATSNFNSTQLMQQNKIKRDLFYRISVLQLEIPSLRSRVEDIEVLAKFFVQVFSLMRSQKACELSSVAIEKLKAHAWNGNVAELENVIERAVALNQGENISENCIQFPQVPNLNFQSAGTTLSEMEQKLILQTLQMTQQNKTRAAQILGISIRTLRNKLNEYREIGVI